MLRERFWNAPVLVPIPAYHSVSGLLPLKGPRRAGWIGVPQDAQDGHVELDLQLGPADESHVRRCAERAGVQLLHSLHLGDQSSGAM